MQKNIFSYWHQGFEGAPDIVKSCVKTLIHYNPNYSIHLLDQNSIRDLIDPVPISQDKWNRLRIAHRSDIIRTQLLVKYGGVWADPTVWFCKPLNNWLPDLMSAGVFMFHRPGRDRAVSNWFIAAEDGNPLLKRQYDTLCAYWRENNFDNFDQPMNRRSRMLKRLINRNLDWPRLWLRKPIINLFGNFPYMIYHYMVHDLVRSDADLKVLWDRMPKIPADIPHFPAHKGLLNPLDDETRDFIDSGEAPLFKLTWKLPTDTVPEGSVFEYLLASGTNGSEKRVHDKR